MAAITIKETRKFNWANPGVLKVGDEKGVRGELYPCKPDIFEETYEVIEEQITEQKKAFETLDLYRRKLTIQQYKTLKRQIEAGDTEGFYKGIRKIFRIKGKSYDETDII